MRAALLHRRSYQLGWSRVRCNACAVHQIDAAARCMLQAQRAHAQTEEQFRALYRGKYAPLKEAHARCADDAERLRRGRAAAAEEAEQWRAQVRRRQKCVCRTFDWISPQKWLARAMVPTCKLSTGWVRGWGGTYISVAAA